MAFLRVQTTCIEIIQTVLMEKVPFLLPDMTVVIAKNLIFSYATPKEAVK